MLSENKFSKYLLYAIGEIVLVVIGILIALSINNSNEKHKLHDQVTTQLKLLSIELSDDIAIYEQKIDIYPYSIRYLKDLSIGNYEELDLSEFESIVAGNDIEILFGDSYRVLKNSGGINEIKNESLKKNLGAYNNLGRMKLNVLLAYGLSSSLAFLDESVLSYMEYDTSNTLVRDNTINVIKEKSLNNIINLQLQRNIQILESYKETNEYAKKLKEQLDGYIETRE
ncbi:MAG: hypothetical protein AB8F78_09160 [Saprospiraceae bacterium]